MTRIERTALSDVVEFFPTRHGDDRGWFCETWNAATWAELGLPPCDWVQDNESFSSTVGTIRGIHYQLDPHPQDKLVRVLRGSILDVAVDLRRSSPTFGEHVAVTLSADAGNQLFIPKGFGHAFCTLEPDCQLAYKVSGRYAPECEASIRFDDPDLAIAWPTAADRAVVSAKDGDAGDFANAAVFT